MQKICFISTHGIGKTTLSYQQASYYKTIGKNVKRIKKLLGFVRHKNGKSARLIAKKRSRAAILDLFGDL